MTVDGQDWGGWEPAGRSQRTTPRSFEVEVEVGERRLRAVEAEQTQLRDTLLRISGAIQVLRELLDRDPSVAQLGASVD